ncbi:MAG: hypothetical protein U5K37_12125 [Natrialbaceae archaeon]|nr:hypothetical protein [Natrialbaceae archaeon]
MTVPLGNLFFWGNVNVLGTIDDPTNGMVAQFGPFYHFDLLVPFAIFGAYGLVRTVEWIVPLAKKQAQLRVGPQSQGRLHCVGCAMAVARSGTVTGALVMPPARA